MVDNNNKMKQRMQEKQQVPDTEQFDITKEFWARKDAQDVYSYIEDFKSKFEINLSRQDGVFNQYNRNLAAYYSNLFEGDGQTSLGRRGDQAELLKMVSNQARSYIRDYVSIVTKQRLEFQPYASNTDVSSLEQSQLAAGLCDYLVRDQVLDKKGERLVEHDQVLGVGFLHLHWNTAKGKQVKVVQSEHGPITVHTGKPEVNNLLIFDIIFDWTKNTFEEADWVAVRMRKNRWSLIAQYPEFADELMRAPSWIEEAMINRNQLIVDRYITDNPDDICVYEFTHRDTPAVPGGRYILYAAAGLILTDEDNPLGEELPVVCMRSNPIENMSLGYATMTDLLPLQEMLDANLSMIATNQAAHGVANIAIPNNSDFSVTQTSGGLNVIKYTPTAEPGGGKPESVNLLKTPSELFKSGDMYKAHMGELSHISGALRGQPPTGVTSGTAIATLSANSLEFTQGTQKAYVICLEKLMMMYLRMLRVRAVLDQIVEIAGKNDELIAKTWKGEDLDGVEKVYLKIGNPLTATLAGRLEIAGQLLQAGQADAKRYLELLETGNIDTITEDHNNELRLIDQENDNLMSSDKLKNIDLSVVDQMDEQQRITYMSQILTGIMVRAYSTDDHAYHIQRHKALLNNLNIRFNEKVARLIQAHIEEHEMLQGQTRPELMAAANTGKFPQGSLPQMQQRADQAQQQQQGPINAGPGPGQPAAVQRPQLVNGGQ